jgi:hypothetical protein
MVGDALQLHGGETSSEPVVLRSGVWKTEHLVLARPPGRDIAETGNSNPARQATFDGCFDQIGCQKGERDRHVDLADAAFLARGNLFDISHGAGDVSSSQSRPRAIDENGGLPWVDMSGRRFIDARPRQTQQYR